ncbi:MAG: hypothetical protein KDB18_12690, partial [Salinibacterium sp.]|nr:hypothetical protein [Salinibacterium sp.]
SGWALISTGVLLLLATILARVFAERRATRDLGTVRIGSTLDRWLTQAGLPHGFPELERGFAALFRAEQDVEPSDAERKRLYRSAAEGLKRFLERKISVPTARVAALRHLRASVRARLAAADLGRARLERSPAQRKRLARDARRALEVMRAELPEGDPVSTASRPIYVEACLELQDLDGARREIQVLEHYGTSSVSGDARRRLAHHLGASIVEHGSLSADLADEIQGLLRVHEASPLSDLLLAGRAFVFSDRPRAAIPIFELALARRHASDASDKDVVFDLTRDLARAHLRAGHHSRALSFYSVLVSLNEPANRWFRDPEVLREIGGAERALETRDDGTKSPLESPPPGG